MNVCQILSQNESHSKHSELRENALTLTLKEFPLFAHWCGSQKLKTYSFAQVRALAMRFKKKTNLKNQ